MRDQLNTIRAEIEAARKLPMMLAAARIWPIVFMVWGLLDSIVTYIERSSPNGGGSTDRHV